MFLSSGNRLISGLFFVLAKKKRVHFRPGADIRLQQL
jgi:hypothetical protein